MSIINEICNIADNMVENIKCFKEKIKLKNVKREIENYKYSTNKLLSDISSLEAELNAYYNANLVNCKYYSCLVQCCSDVGFCIDHYPLFCSNCNQPTDPNNPNDILYSNNKYKYTNYCYNCIINIYTKSFETNHPLSKLFKHPTDKLQEYCFNYMFEQYKLNFNVYIDILEHQEKNGLKDHEIKALLCNEEFVVQVFNIPKSEIKFATKWYLYRQLSRSFEIFEMFGDKLKFINFSPLRFRRMTNAQFDAFKRYLCKVILNKSWGEYILETVYNAHGVKNIWYNEPEKYADLIT